MIVEASSYPVGRHRRGRGFALPLLLTALLTVALAACGSAGSDAAAPTTTPPETVTLLTAKASFGTYLTDGAGRALYMWEADRAGSSTCYDDCAVDWPPLTVSGHVTAGPKVDADLIGKTTRKDGTTEVTYGGWPLYYFKPDVRPGQLSGQGDTGYGAVWWVLSPEGNPLPSAPQG